MTETSVLIADDDVIVREIMSVYISRDSSLHLVATAKDAAETIELAGKHRPQVALVDVSMPGNSGPQLVKEIRRCSPDTRVLALSSHDDQGTVEDMLAAGAATYLVKGTPPIEILAAIRNVAQA